MTARRRLVRVPASSANLGPGYDVLAAALSLELELEVTEASEFSVEAGPDLPTDRSNLCVRAFERLHPAAAHAPHLEAPEQTLAAVARFLQAHAAPRPVPRIP